jgi:hypothetical protein
VMHASPEDSSFGVQSKAELLSQLANAVIKTEKFYTWDSGK